MNKETELAKRLAELLGYRIKGENSGAVYVATGERIPCDKWFDPCNVPNDLIPIMEQHKISVDPLDNEWAARLRDEWGGYKFLSKNEYMLTAITECLIKVLESEGQQGKK